MTTAVAAKSTTTPIGRRRWTSLTAKYGVYGGIIVLIVVNIFISTDFVSLSNLRVQLYQAVPVLIVALGMALVIGTEGIDLSVGAVIALSSSILPLYLGYGVWVSVALAILAGGVAGLISGSLVAFARVQPIVATLAMMIGLRGLAVIMNGATAKPIDDMTLLDLGLTGWLSLPTMAYVAVVLVAIVAFVMRRTTLGRNLVAVGDNPSASFLSGLPVRRILLAVYIASGMLAAVAGILIAGHGAYADPANYGLNYELLAITAVVVGGTPLSGGQVRVIGTVAGTIFMQLVTATLVQNNVKNSYAQMVEAVIICIAVFVARESANR